MARKALKTLVPHNPNEAADNASLKEQIAALANALWRERGCPDGSPDDDWFAAEEQIRQRRKSQIVTLLKDRRTGPRA